MKVYEVFSRHRSTDPLIHIGSVNAPNDELAKVYAWKIYDEETWVEMCVAPREALMPVNRTDSPPIKGN